MMHWLFPLLFVAAFVQAIAHEASSTTSQEPPDVGEARHFADGDQKLLAHPGHGPSKNMSITLLPGGITLIERLKISLRELPHVVAHVMPELNRSKPLPGDAYRSNKGPKKQKRFSPSHHEVPWLPKLSESDLRSHIPTWHGWVALKLPRQCNSCERVVEVVSEFARKSFHDHDLRMCASFALVSYDTGSADAGPQARVAMPPLLGSPPEPVLVWLPPMHELHNIHERPVIFNGPWTGVEISRFVHNRCTRASRIGRAFVGDIFASQFVRATDVNKQQEVLKGLRKLQWQYREGRTQPEVQQRLRYYEDLIDEAMTEGAIGPEHFIKLSLRLERQLQMEVYKDALAEVNLIKHNVVQAFLESAGDPTVVHNFVNVGNATNIKEAAQKMKTSA